ncbi:MAG: SMP-30/gluconolactonase/LRE family protein [Opitutales bacterium]|nr:SMP-30/gluconolactonase/LRE family protein [Opitutales bacterium]NRA27149.1 SMP-30/gluconolactonase/LRE family protein [Opitutales bacterium]
MHSVELIVDAQAILGEGPIWDERRNLLWWVDIITGKLHAYDPITDAARAIDTEPLFGTVVVRESGGLLGAYHDGFHYLDPETGTRTLISDPESDKPDNRFNDGKCDPQGRLWAGTMAIEGPYSEPKGSLYCLGLDESVERKIDAVTISNGIGWSPDGRWMYYVDSPERTVSRFEFDGKTGEISKPTRVISYPKKGGVPDGLVVDAEGMLWVAQFGGGCVVRWNPENGEKLTEIQLPAKQITACTFGGPGLKDLYITSARVGLSDSELAEQPQAGGLFRVRGAGRGMLANRFGG